MKERALSPPVALLLVWLIAIGACAGPPGVDGPPPVRGPLEARIQHPLALNLLGPRPRRAAPSGAGHWRLAWHNAYSSIYEENRGAGQSVVFDGEYLHSSLSARVGLGERTDFELTLGLLYGTSGFLDGFADGFHDALALPEGGRDTVAQDQYLMRIRQDGEVLYDLEEDRVGLLDLPLWIVHTLVLEDEGRPGVALRAGVELPVGSEARGFGNGSLDWGAGVLLEKSVGRFTWTGGIDFVWTGQPEAFEEANVAIDEIVQLALGGEYRVTSATSLLVQMLWYSPLVSDFDLEEINREILDLGLGLSTDLGPNVRLYTAFHEDLVAATGSDFTFLMGLFWTI